MDVISPSRPVARTQLFPLVSGTVFGTLFIVGGLVMAYVAFATPFLDLARPSGRPDIGQAAIGIGIWAVALVAKHSDTSATKKLRQRIMATLQ